METTKKYYFSDLGLRNAHINFRQFEQTHTIPDEGKRKQEIRPFQRIDDSFRKIVITRDIVSAHYDEYGSLTLNVYDFLLNPEGFLNKTIHGAVERVMVACKKAIECYSKSLRSEFWE